MPRTNCQLCEAEEITPWLYEDGICWVTLCVECKVPMVVLWRHTSCPTRRERAAMMESLRGPADAFFGEGEWYFDGEMRTLPLHAHMHARPI